jgi:hypothetical protein
VTCSGRNSLTKPGVARRSSVRPGTRSTAPTRPCAPSLDDTCVTKDQTGSAARSAMPRSSRRPRLAATTRPARRGLPAPTGAGSGPERSIRLAAAPTPPARSAAQPGERLPVVRPICGLFAAETGSGPGQGPRPSPPHRRDHLLPGRPSSAIGSSRGVAYGVASRRRVVSVQPPRTQVEPSRSKIGSASLRERAPEIQIKRHPLRPRSPIQPLENPPCLDLGYAPELRETDAIRSTARASS